MTISVVQQATPTTQAPGTSGTVVLTGVAAGNELIILVGCSVGDLTSTFAAADSQSQTVLTAASANTSHGTYYIFYIENANAGSHTITITPSQSLNFTAAMAEITGTGTSGTLDTVSTTATGFGTAIAANSATPSVTGEFVVAALGSDGFGAPANVTWTSPLTGGTGTLTCLNWAYDTLSTTAGFAAQGTYSSGADWVIATAFFKPSAPVVNSAGSPILLLGV